MSTSNGVAAKSVKESQGDLFAATGSDDKQRTKASASLCGGTVDRLNRFLSSMPSLTSSVASNSNRILERFLQQCPSNPWAPSTPQVPTTEASIEVFDRLSHLAVESASIFRAIASKDRRLETRKDMQMASLDIMKHELAEKDSPALLSDSELSSAFALSLVTAAIALSAASDTRDVNRSAASAICTTLQQAKTIYPNFSSDSGTNIVLFHDLVHALIVETTKETLRGTDLHILTSLARALDVTSCSSSSLAEEALGEVIRTATRLLHDSSSPVEDSEKIAIAAALALANNTRWCCRTIMPWPTCSITLR